MAHGSGRTNGLPAEPRGAVASQAGPATSNVATTTRALAEALRARLGSRDARIEDAPPRPGDVERSVLDPSAALSILGALTPLDRGLDQTVAWFRARDSARDA